MGAPDSLARWAIAVLLLLAGCGLAATCLLWAEDTGRLAAACRTLRTACAAARRRATTARLYITTLIGAHRR